MTDGGQAAERQQRATSHRSSRNWSLLALALGAWAPLLLVYLRTQRNISGSAALLVSAAALVAALRGLGARRPTALVWALASAAVGIAIVAPRTGRAPLVVTWVLVILAHGALVRWRPWEQVEPGARAWIAAGAVLVAGCLWRATNALAPVAPVALLGLVALEWMRASPEVAGRIDNIVGRSGRWLQRRLAGPIGMVAAWRYLGVVRSDLRAWVAAPKSRRDRSLLAAMGVGFGLRAVWAASMTQEHAEWFSRWNLIFAESFARGQTPSYHGTHTAFWPPAYGATIAPFQWLDDRVGWFEVHWAAAAFNVLIGTATIALVGVLAEKWFGERARNPAAWIMALAFGQVFITSAAVGEPLGAMLVVIVVILATEIVDRGPGRSVAPYVGLGILIGYPALIKDFGFMLFLVPALCIRARRGTWRGAMRPTLAAFAGVLVLLAPWTVRNGVQVGVWSPFSTINADSLCWTRYKLDWIQFESKGTDMVTDEMFEDCNRYSPLNVADGEYSGALPGRDLMLSPPDESRWNQRSTREFLKFLRREPSFLVKIAPLRLYTTAGNDSTGGLSLATQSGEAKIAGPQAMRVYQDAQSAWYYAVVGLVIVGLIRVRAVRRAVPLWAITVFLALYTIPGPRAFSRHYYLAYPLLAVMAAAVVAAAGAGALALEREARRDADDADLNRTSDEDVV